jgi:hypothetical protein
MGATRKGGTAGMQAPQEDPAAKRTQRTNARTRTRHWETENQRSCGKRRTQRDAMPLCHYSGNECRSNRKEARSTHA